MSDVCHLPSLLALPGPTRGGGEGWAAREAFLLLLSTASGLQLSLWMVRPCCFLLEEGSLTQPMAGIVYRFLLSSAGEGGLC